MTRAYGRFQTRRLGMRRWADSVGACTLLVEL